MKIKILHDVYEISKRIKEINSDYFIVYDTERARFEIHNSSQKGNTYCVCVPYAYLDTRTLDYVNQTRVENMEKILNKIETENNLRTRADTRSVQEEMFEHIDAEL